MLACGIGDAGVQSLVNSSKNLKSLKYLDLSCNVITDNGLKMILNSDFNLEEFYLTTNKIKYTSINERPMESLKILQLEEYYTVETVHDMHMEIFYQTGRVPTNVNTPQAQSLHDVALMLQQPQILQVTTRVSLEMLLESAKQGSTQAQYRMGGIYFVKCEPDYGFSQNIDLAIDFLRKAAEKKHPEATALLSVLYEEIGNLEKSFEWCKKASELGDSSSMIRLGYMYDKGNEFIKVDHVLALEMYEKALKIETSSQNYYLLGSLFHEGRCDKFGKVIIGQDYQKAMEYYHECLKLEEDNEWANYHLGIMYKLGEGIDQPNNELAKKYLSRAAELGDDTISEQESNQNLE
ncbi:predicted protein [Naegleria gruberi]|uniref:Predicted protein n=1 Tax=Naegleria gruberi TaxID=5762 RepID=D2VG31_NAEGR|nr:uncharacterized protein NAEGRDRAFT_49245 [Naegleria gruberi]EFC44196.1 predicted protein [Naegleria gruberi]|eukprot:XP_002676940.1 predicted protein [Naegleria gruberi strain NEG-M]